MKKNQQEFGLSDFEREQRRMDREEQFSVIVVLVAVVLVSIYVGWWR